MLEDDPNNHTTQPDSPATLEMHATEEQDTHSSIAPKNLLVTIFEKFTQRSSQKAVEKAENSSAILPMEPYHLTPKQERAEENARVAMSNFKSLPPFKKLAGDATLMVKKHYDDFKARQDGAQVNKSKDKNPPMR